MKPRPPAGRRGAVIAEVIATVVVLGLIAAVLLPLAGEARRNARVGEDLANLRQIGALTGSFIQDNADAYWGFTWKKGTTPSTYPDLKSATTDMDAAACQAVDILRRRADRPDIPRITAWVPHVSFTYLNLVEYAGIGLPNRLFISAGHKTLQSWAGDPAGFDRGIFGALQPPPSPTSKRYPYSSSYQAPSVFWDLATLPADRVYQSTTQSLYIVPGTVVLGAVTLADVAFPSQKVHLHDESSRYFNAKGVYSLHAAARTTMLFVDGGAGLRATADANRGWNPSQPTSPLPSQFTYQPASWETPAVGPAPTDIVSGYFRWTRGTAAKSGIVGRDFGGPEPNP